MKTPDEIKKGLECCGGDCFNGNEECPYDKDDLRENISCIRWMAQDALAYIQQLEADNAKLNRCIENMTDKLNAAHDETVELKRERDAAVADLRVDRHCRTCKNSGCDPSDQPCRSCGIAGKNYEWRGVKDTRTGASDSCTGASGV